MSWRPSPGIPRSILLADTSSTDKKRRSTPVAPIRSRHDPLRVGTGFCGRHAQAKPRDGGSSTNTSPPFHTPSLFLATCGISSFGSSFRTLAGGTAVTRRREDLSPSVLRIKPYDSCSPVSPAAPDSESSFLSFDFRRLELTYTSSDYPTRSDI